MVQICQLSSAKLFVNVPTHVPCFSLQDTERRQSMVCRYLGLVSWVAVYKVRFRPDLETLSIVLASIDRLITTLGEAEEAHAHSTW
jgi:hypothetical protein